MNKKDKQKDKQKISGFSYQHHIVHCPSCGAQALDHMRQCPSCQAELLPGGIKPIDPEKIRRIRRLSNLIGALAAAVILAWYLFLR